MWTRTRSLMERSLRKTWRTGRETLQLGSAWVRHQRPLLQRGNAGGGSVVDLKTILLEHARQHENQTAMRLLLIDKQVGLLRYHGLAGYIRQTLWFNRLTHRLTWKRAMSASSTSDGSSNNTALEGNNSTPNQVIGTAGSSSIDVSSNSKVAKIAFMVTSKMRVELTEVLGYEEQKIRTMTPMEASLVLQHQIPPDQYDSRVPDLVKEAEIEQARQAEAAAAQAQIEAQEAKSAALARRQQQQQQAAKSAAVSAPLEEKLESTTDDMQRHVSLETGVASVPAPPAVNTKQVHNDTVGSKNLGKVWYELVETSPDAGNTDTVVGLYKSDKEAEEGLQVRNELTKNRPKPHMQYSIRTSIR